MSLSPANRERAIELWSEGKTLGEIATTLGCSIYDLSPWIYKPEMDAAYAEAEARMREQDERQGG